MIPGGEADRSGLVNVGDVVSSIDAQDVKHIAINKLAQRIRGPIGTRIQIGFKAQHGGSEKNMDLPRIPAAGASASPLRRPSSVASNTLSQTAKWDPMAVLPVQLSFLSDQQAQARVEPHAAGRRQEPTHLVHQQEYDWHLTPVAGGVPHVARASDKSASPGRSPKHLKEARASSAPFAVQDAPSEAAASRTASDAPWTSGVSKEPLITPLAAKHDIWGTLEQLDASIQRRNTDMRSFTESLLLLQQADGTDSSPRKPLDAGASSASSPFKTLPHAVGDLFYA
jgi:hypothetical protein